MLAKNICTFPIFSHNVSDKMTTQYSCTHIILPFPEMISLLVLNLLIILYHANNWTSLVTREQGITFLQLNLKNPLLTSHKLKPEFTPLPFVMFKCLCYNFVVLTLCAQRSNLCDVIYEWPLTDPSPVFLWTSLSAWSLMSRSTMDGCPLAAAMCRGVLPSFRAWLTWAPASKFFLLN